MINPHPVLDGLPSLKEGINAQPTLVLSFYPYGVILRKHHEGGIQEYVVDPRQIAEHLRTKTKTVKIGFIRENTLYVESDGLGNSIVAEYRPPQITGLFLEGSEQPLRVPLPGLVMIRNLNNGKTSYGVYAVKQPARPNSVTPLYEAPLPNTGNGRICWGSVNKVSPASLEGYSLEEDWRQLLGSTFGSHQTYDKSQRYNHDIRKQLIELDQKRSVRYPTNDLIPSQTTLGQLLENQQ